LRDCATSTAGGERVERGKAAEIASPSCVHGIDGRGEVDVFEAGLCIFYGRLKATPAKQHLAYTCAIIHAYTTSPVRKVCRNFLMSLIRKIMHPGRKK